MIPPRQHPLNRRVGVTQRVTGGGTAAEATCNLYRDGRPCEVFLSTDKPGSPLCHLAQDAAVIISIALQHGIPAAALAKSVARIESGTEAASIIGAALDLIVELEAQAARPTPIPPLAVERGLRQPVEP